MPSAASRPPISISARSIIAACGAGVAMYCFCMLAYYVTWHMQQALAPMLFADRDKQVADGQRTSPVAH